MGTRPPAVVLRAPSAVRASPSRAARAALLTLGAWLPARPAGAQAPAAQEPSAHEPAGCAVAGRLIDAAWREYRAGRLGAAGTLFSRAAACENSDPAANTGLGYIALREDRGEDARALFDGVLARDAASVDALVGRGLLAWRDADPGLAAALARRALALAPSNGDARSLLERVEASGWRPARVVERPPLVLPDTLEYPARTHGDRFEIRTPDGWAPFYIKGVNLGAALPGRHPSQFPDSATYARWIDGMSAMGANVVRTYTIHPPVFYDALRAHNIAHPEHPLWLVHGVWTELPPDDDYEDPEWEGAFFAEMRRVVELVHGRADLEARPGHASGSYTADVSPWTLAYIIGREWEPYSVVEFNAMRPELSSWKGRYLTLAAGTPMEVWLARACEELIAYETSTYRAQRPIAYTNWPTLDPMRHPTETTVDEEVAIREGLGEEVGRAPLEYDNDATGLETGAVRPTAAFPAGYFASYHAYPYYPDFMILDPEYAKARSPWGASNYFGYLRDLKRRHPDVPVIVAEYGVPASIGVAHLQPQGWHHGGHTEASMADIDVRLTREIAEAGLAGGILFAWIDEWFKKNWIVIEFEIPLERNRLWLNRLDAEQHYGVIAMEPERRIPGETPAERAAGWRARPALYTGSDGSTLRAVADEAYLTLFYDAGPGGGPGLPDHLRIGFDTVDPDAGDRRWPGAIGDTLPLGIEFALDVTPTSARLLVDRPSSPFRLDPVRGSLPRDDLETPPVPPARATQGAVSAPVPQRTFAARREQRFQRPFRSRPNADGRFDSLRVITNRPRFGRDSTEYLALGYDRGVLPGGPAPDGLWETDATRGLIEVRIPWMLLGFTDPSERRVLQELPEGTTRASIGAERAGPSDAAAAGAFGTVTVPDIGIVAAVERDGRRRAWPARGEGVARFTWERWDTPSWRARTRPLYEALERAFATLDPAVTRGRIAEEHGGGR